MTPIEKRTAIRRGDPITECGLTLYPITMNDYELFEACKDGILVRQMSLPVRCLPYDYLSALFMMEMEQLLKPEKERKDFGFFLKALQFLLLCLGNEITLEEFFTRRVHFTRTSDGVRLDYLNVPQKDKEIKITPTQFSMFIRPIIAAQNGLKLPNEDENLDLVRSVEERKKFYAERSRVKVDYNIDDLIGTVALSCGMTDREICQMTVKEFDERRRAIERSRSHLVNALAETSGLVNFKKGNPCPSLFFDAIDDTYGLVEFGELPVKGVGFKN